MSEAAEGGSRGRGSRVGISCTSVRDGLGSAAQAAISGRETPMRICMEQPHSAQELGVPSSPAGAASIALALGAGGGMGGRPDACTASASSSPKRLKASTASTTLLVAGCSSARDASTAATAWYASDAGSHRLSNPFSVEGTR
jgi:hypothetical protein